LWHHTNYVKSFELAYILVWQTLTCNQAES
jgi:hypothetical protein